ncbi:hypothetical protein MANES_02G125000v8 [Manihot esculenta]|uniref:SHSP domain-containing protein n=1 Tax=Manihot esculenta TaxID=3983 RepID=A0A2C9WDN6_MANES|nr:hypothetical protein MANES_02G125000v8 [Manihot esculenta]
MAMIRSFFGDRRSGVFDHFSSFDFSDPPKNFPFPSTLSQENIARLLPWPHCESIDGHRVEHSSGKFLRRFRLPENVKMDEVKVSMENGVLTVIVPKVEAKKPDVKAIEISC